MAVTLPGVLVNLTEYDVLVATDEGLGVVVAVLFRLGGVPHHDGVPVAEISVKIRAVQAGGLGGCRAFLHVVQHLFHFAEILHAEFAAFRQLQPVLLPVVAAVDLQGVEVHAVCGILEPRNQVRNGGDILIEAVLVENPHPVTGTDGITREQEIVALEEIDHGTGRMTRDGDGLDRHAAEFESLSLPDEFAAVLGNAVGIAGEVRLRYRKTDAGHLQHRGKHAGVVTVAVGEGHRHGLVPGTLRDKGTERFRGVVGPVDGIGQVDDQGFVRSDDQVNVGAVVEMRQLAIGIKGFPGGVRSVVILDVIDILVDDGNGVRSDFHVLGTGAGSQGRSERDRTKILEAGKFHKVNG